MILIFFEGNEGMQWFNSMFKFFVCRRTERSFQDSNQLAMVFVAKRLCTVAQAHMRGCMDIFSGGRGMHQTGVMSTSACAGVYTTQMFLTLVYIFANTLFIGCAHALAYVQFVH